jgi:hypothetical protein
MKKVFFIWAVVMVLFFGMGTGIKNASAQTLPQGWHTCDIITVGPLFNHTLATLTCDGQAANQWVTFGTDTKKELLAAALTARSLNARVRAWVHADTVSVAGVDAQWLYGLMLRPQQ